MLMPNLRKTLVMTKTSKIVGWIDENFVRSIDKGFMFNGSNVGYKDYLNFYGSPNGGDVEVVEIVVEGENKWEKPVKRIFSSYQIPASSILFLFDLKPMMPTGNKPEKRLVEERSQLASVMVRLDDFGVTIKGKTYLHKRAYDQRIIKIEAKDNKWFILQFPEFPDGYSNKFNKTLGLTKIAEAEGYHLDHILFNMSNVIVSI
ncbi:hypothetical protein JXA84_01015 [candidate division WOR-3 bacterium]|nr:hypothetical protein [candidate division WOR-3 bacterium]